MGRLRDGELIAGAGAVVLLVALFASWYSGASAWQAFSVLDIVLALVASLALALVIAQATRESPSVPVALSVLTAVAGTLATLFVIYRILNQPGPNDAVEVGAGAWIGLAAAALIAVGGARSMRVEAIPGAARPPIEDLPAPAP